MRRCFVINYSDGRSDPPTRMCAEAFAKLGFHVTIIQGPRLAAIKTEPLANVSVVEVGRYVSSIRVAFLRSLARWILFRFVVFFMMKIQSPEVVVTLMLHALAAVPKRRSRSILIACIYDIPVMEDTGRLDALILDKGWSRLRDADVVWSSDPYKATATASIGHLSKPPIVVYNCPSTDYIQSDSFYRDPWLRSELINTGMSVDDETCIIIRAGAIGPLGGIEETIEALQRLPPKLVFLLMGRPDTAYAENLRALIISCCLQDRVILWEAPNDTIWKLALQGADVGHLIHGPLWEGKLLRSYQVNSSLSNNRLFQYMAASLPILSYNDPRLDRLHREVGCFEVVRVEQMVDDIEKACAKLSASAELRYQMGARGRQAHLDFYNWGHQFSKVLTTVLQDPLFSNVKGKDKCASL